MNLRAENLTKSFDGLRALIPLARMAAISRRRWSGVIAAGSSKLWHMAGLLGACLAADGAVPTTAYAWRPARCLADFGISALATVYLPGRSSKCRSGVRTEPRQPPSEEMNVVEDRGHATYPNSEDVLPVGRCGSKCSVL